MRWAVVTLAVASSIQAAGIARPQEPVTDDFGSLSTRIRTDPTIDGQWEAAAQDHRTMRVRRRPDEDRAGGDRYSDPEVVDEEADYYAARGGGPFDAAWTSTVMRDRDMACASPMQCGARRAAIFLVSCASATASSWLAAFTRETE